jgi:hypothetical protein
MAAEAVGPMHDRQVELIAAALDVRDDVYDAAMSQFPPELHEPLWRAVTAGVSGTLGVIDKDYMVLPKVYHDGDVNMAGDLKSIFDSMYDTVNT